MFRPFTFSVLCLASLSVVLSATAAEDESAADLKKMAGDWVPHLVQVNGKKQPDEFAAAIKLTIIGNKYNTVVGPEKDEGTLKLDATKSPREMDIISNVGAAKGKTIPCIYEIKEDELRVCYGLKGARPADLKAGENEKEIVMLIAYKRAAKKE